ncbi:uncharacterized protein LOC130810775 [Amaranthus tricolor]|uniref:uncharacterized protein LOC130810775 n=1 Tax=Amaranthus tricolor TaxID=29722 RepID=UPI0025881352|nr:uncharacterized protein LOC130810775 [Amaranthus tricolor]
MSASKSSHSFHPALAVSNIKTHVPITLEMENIQYANWAELFKVHCRSHRVLHHIIKPKNPDGTDKEPDDDHDMWDTLDAAVVQWIYSTISTDLLNTVIEADVSAMTLWNRLRDLFQDNENSRAVALDHEFNNTYLRDFPSVSAYCQHLKTLADQLKNVGAPVSNNRLVLRMVAGLTSAYQGVASVIRHKKVLPPFYEVRSMLALEEASMKGVTAGGDEAMVAAAKDTNDSSDYGAQRPDYDGHIKLPRNRNNKSRNNGHGGRINSGGYGPRTGGRGNRGNSGGNGGSRGGHAGGHGSQHQWQQWWSLMQRFPWAMPPCPYPTQPWGRQHGLGQSGILGPKPQQQQAHVADSQWTPTAIESAMHTMTLSPPDSNWYMDTGATSHMTSTQDREAANEM